MLIHTNIHLTTFKNNTPSFAYNSLLINNHIFDVHLKITHVSEKGIYVCAYFLLVLHFNFQILCVLMYIINYFLTISQEI